MPRALAVFMLIVNSKRVGRSMGMSAGRVPCSTFTITPPADRLAVHIDTRRDGDRVFDATLSLERRPWTREEIRRQLVRFPAMTASVIGAIHWEALRLWRKGVPVVSRLTRDGVGERVGIASGEVAYLLDTPGDLGGGEKFKAADLADLAQVEAICEGVDGILHFGGYSVEGSWDQIHQANIVGCYNLFEAAYRKGVKRVIFASTNKVYGDQLYPSFATLGERRSFKMTFGTRF